MSQRIGLFLLLLLSVGHLWMYRDNAVDDAYITYRYGRSLRQGQGLTFNPGQRVEGYSNPSWTVLSAAIQQVSPRDPHRWMQALGALFSLLALWLLGCATGELFPEEPIWRWLAPCLLLARPGWAFYAMSGLETPLYICLITAGIWLLLREGPGWKMGLAMGLAALTRPEAPYIFGLLLAVGWLRRDRHDRSFWGPRLWQAVACFGLCMGGWLLFRWLYYGELLPNTYYAKRLRLELSLRLGWGYIVRYLQQLLWLPLVALLLVLSRRRWDIAAIGGVWLLAVLPILRLGPDWMPHFRFFYHVAPLEVLLWVGGAWALAQWLELIPKVRAVVMGPLAVASLTVLLLSHSMQAANSSNENGRAIRHTYRLLGTWLRHQKTKGPIALVDVGAIAYFARVPVIDLAGLTDRYIARRPGMIHEKRFDASYVLKQKPAFVLLHTHGPVHWFKHRKQVIVKMRGQRPLKLDLTKQPYVPPGRMFRVERNLYFHPGFQKGYRYVGSLVIRRKGKHVLYTQSIFRRSDIQISHPFARLIKQNKRLSTTSSPK